MSIKNALPIRKVAVGAVAWGVYYVAQKAGLGTITNDVSNEVAQGLVTFAALYIVPDPRVQKVEQKVSAWAKLRALNGLLAYAASGTNPAVPVVVPPAPVEPVAPVKPPVAPPAA